MSYARFMFDLMTAYKELSSRLLRDELLQPIGTVFAQLYTQGNITPKTRPIYLRACVEALLDFTARIHPYCLDPMPSNAIFHQTVQLSDCVFASHADGGTWASGMDAAYQALAKPFKNEAIRNLFPDHKGHFNYQRDERSFSDLEEPLPFGSTDAAKRAYERRRQAFHDRQTKANDKAWTQGYDALQCYQLPFLSTPLFAHSHEFIPHGRVEIPYDIPQHLWFESCWIVGTTGSGKTSLLRHLILNLHKDASIILLDAKGDLFKTFSRHAPFKDRLVIIEPDLDHPPQLNPLQMGSNADEFLAYLFEVLDTKMSGLQDTFFHKVVTLASLVPNATLTDVQEIIVNEKPYLEKYGAQLDADDQRWWKFTLPNDRNAKDRRTDVLNRLDRLLRKPILKSMLKAPANLLDIGKHMDAGDVVLVNATYDPDKLGEEHCEFFGRMIIAMIWAAARRRQGRREDQKRPVYLVMDEAHMFIKNDITLRKILNQCRSQNVGVIMAHQEVCDIQNTEVLSALTGRKIKFFNSTGEAHELAPRLDPANPDPAFIANLPQKMFAVKVDTQPPVHLTVPPVNERNNLLTDYPQIGDHEFNALMLTMRARYCTAPKASAPPRSDDLMTENITINPRLADKGGIYVAKVRMDPHGRTWKRVNTVTLPAKMRDGFRVKLNGYGVFRANGSRGDIVHVLYRRKSDAPESIQPEADPPPRSKKKAW